MYDRIGHLNRPAAFVYGGIIPPGFTQSDTGKCNPMDIVSVFEAVGKYAKGALDELGLKDVESNAIPGPGSCGGMYTANTMASAIEALGMSLPGSSAQTAVGASKKKDCENAGQAVVNLIEKNICPRDILTRKAFENAITTCLALGGSTNLILHLLAIAHSADVELTIDDFDLIGQKSLYLQTLSPLKIPHEPPHSNWWHPPDDETLLERGLLHGDCLTVTGETIAESLKEVEHYGSIPTSRTLSDLGTIQ